MSASSDATPTPPPAKPVVGKSGKKICCACPDTRKPRDACVVERGEEQCRALIDAHDACLRLDGFVVPLKSWVTQ
jgi:cytochrome c oxidase assembly protein subunit 17